MPNIRWLLALITSVHRFLYRASGGWIGHRGPGFRFLLLGCRGRKSGREYVTPLLYVPDGERFVVVGSNAGDARDPAWWKNLQANPDAWAQVGRERIAVRARAANDAEAELLWPRVFAAYASFERYRMRAGREIPLVLLERCDPPPASDGGLPHRPSRRPRSMPRSVRGSGAPPSGRTPASD